MTTQGSGSGQLANQAVLLHVPGSFLECLQFFASALASNRPGVAAHSAPHCSYCM
jgi:hypothetical protein